MIRNSKELKSSVGYLLYHLTALLHRKVKKELDTLNLTHTQFIILATLYRLLDKQDNITQVDIATESQMDKMMVSKVLRNLQQKKLVSRIEHSYDTRAKVVVITPSGIELVNQAYVLVKKVELNFFKVLGGDKIQFEGQIQKILKENK